MPKLDPIAPPVTGLVAGKYELVGLIGRGGMGSVWEGRHQSLGTRVAIKFIESDYVESSEARSRFDNEARAAATIQSKHAIQIFDHGVSPEGNPYIVMELLTGEPLDKRLERVGRMPLAEVARILGQVCRALGRAHDKGIIHRDLKPENVFLVRTPDDDDEIAKVLDFGIAKFAQPTALGISSGTKTGAVLGTPYYMSPEQARGLRSIDHRSDLWSLGVIAYKCVVGTLPFDGESIGDLLVKICTAPLPVPSQVAGDGSVPPSFDAWFARALEREPARRFATAHELAEGLAQLAGIASRRSADGARGGSRPPSQFPPPWNPTAQSAVPPRLGSNSPGAAALAQAATQAQFSATGSRLASTGRARGVWLASGMAAVVGLTLGAGAVVKLAGSGPPVGSSTAASAEIAPDAARGLVANGAMPLGAVEARDAGLARPAASPSAARAGADEPPSIEVADPSAASPSPRPGASPAAASLAAKTPRPKPTASVLLPAPVAPPAPPPAAKPKPAVVDPGY